MVISKYLTKANLKKTTFNIFIPMLFGFKNNKLVKTFYYENMFYKIFYLIFNHILLVEVFLKDKKIFYNFSKYFQINLYIFLLKTNSIILNLFFYFFYMLFMTFENFEDLYYNKILFKGYKQRHKYKRFAKYWIKPDHNLKFYFNQRVNSISLYVLNFNIYKNIYFSKFNIFLSHTSLIYKLFYYFKILQYKLQSFVILYKRHFKVEKKIRKFFSKNNCNIYKHLNNKLIKLFSFYKIHIKKKNILSVNPIIFKEQNKIKNKKLINKKIENDLDLIKKRLLNDFQILYNIDFNDNFKFFFLQLNITNNQQFDIFNKVFQALFFLKKNYKDYFPFYLNDILVSFINKRNYLSKKTQKRIKLFEMIRIFKKFLKKTLNNFIYDLCELNNFTPESEYINKIINFTYKEFKFNNLFKGIEDYNKNFSKFISNVIDVNMTYLQEDFKDLKFLREMDRFFKQLKKFEAYCDPRHATYATEELYTIIHGEIVEDYFANTINTVTYLDEKKYAEMMFKKQYYDALGKASYYFNRIKYKTSVELLDLFKKNRNKKLKFYLLNLLSKKLKYKKIININNKKTIKKFKKFKLKNERKLFLKINKIKIFFFKRKKKMNFLKSNINSTVFNKKYLNFINNYKNLIVDSKNNLKTKFINKNNLIKTNYKFLLKILKILKNQFINAVKNNIYDLSIILFEQSKLIKKKIKNFLKKKKYNKNTFKLKTKLFNNLKKKKLKKNSFFHYYSTRIDKFKRFNKFKTNKKNFNYKINKKFNKFNKKHYNIKIYRPLKINKFNYKIVNLIDKFIKYMKSPKYGKYLAHTNINVLNGYRKRYLNPIFFNSVKIKRKIFNSFYFKDKVAQKKFYSMLLLKKKIYTKCFKGFKNKKKQKLFFKKLNNFKYNISKKKKTFRLLK